MYHQPAYQPEYEQPAHGQQPVGIQNLPGNPVLRTLAEQKAYNDIARIWEKAARTVNATAQPSQHPHVTDANDLQPLPAELEAQEVPTRAPQLQPVANLKAEEQPERLVSPQRDVAPSLARRCIKREDPEHDNLPFAAQYSLKRERPKDEDSIVPARRSTRLRRSEQDRATAPAQRTISEVRSVAARYGSPPKKLDRLRKP
jgi:hypothetical protein